MSQIVDIDLRGEYANNSLQTYVDENAVGNALQFYLASRVGSFILNPTYGGGLDFLVFKSLNTDTQMLTRLIENDIDENFGALLEVVWVEITPNTELRTFQVSVSYRYLSTGSESTITFDSLSQDTFMGEVPARQPYVLQDVPFTDDTLFSFIETNLDNPDNMGELFEFDHTRNLWRWGVYVFINLLESDPRFTDLLELINMRPGQ